MQSQDNGVRQRVLTKTVWLLCAVAISALEFFVPRLPFFPWLKPGLANVITMIWIFEFGVIDAIAYCLLRTWIVGFYFGFSFLSISLSASGAILATLAMGAFWTLLGKNRLIGTVGLGVLGALFHNLGQLLAVYFLMAANIHLFFQIPVMLIASIVFGGFVGLAAPSVYSVLSSSEPDYSHANLISPPVLAATRKEFFFSFALLAGSMAIVFLDSMATLAACACCATLLVQIQKKGSLSALVKPATGFWVLFLFIACVNLFFSYGTSLERLPFLTREGVDLTLKQWLRLWTWLEISFLLSYFRFHSVLYHSLRNIFSNHKETIFAGLLALEYFPAIAEESRTWAKRSWKDFFSGHYPAKDRLKKTRNAPLEQPGLSGFLKKQAAVLYKLVIEKVEKYHL